MVMYMHRLNVFILDSDMVFTTNVCRALSECTSLQVVGIEHDGINGLSMIQSLKPDIVIMDIQLPCLDGISVLRETRLMKQPPVSIICTHFYSDFCIMNAQQNGAAYVLYKPLDFRTLSDTILNCHGSVSSSAIRNNVASGSHDIEAEDAYRIRTILFNMGMPPRFVGSMYIVESILMAMENKMLLGNLSKGLYAEMSARMHASPESIERSLRNAISTTYERGTMSALFDHRPTNKQFLMYLIRKVSEESHDRRFS
ncbi:MAG: response regulator [Clostridiales bacterium]|nr:response regulator [Clostridiales bacterium]